MTAKIKTYIITTLFLMTANVLLIGYIHGYRLANFSEVPNSQRPNGLFTNVEMDMIGANYAQARK